MKNFSLKFLLVYEKTLSLSFSDNINTFQIVEQYLEWLKATSMLHKQREMWITVKVRTAF